MTETMVTHATMVSQIDAAVLAERERCAKIADGFHGNGQFIAAAIRGSGNREDA